MARRTEITLAQVGWSVRKASEQQLDDKGNPLFGDSGLPRMVDLWILDLIENTPNGVEIIHVPFDEAAKERLVQALTGGLVVASELPKGALAI